MASKLIDGDYRRDENGNAVTVEYVDELLQNAFVTLSTRRGRFYPNKNFGSRIKESAELPREEYVFAYAVQALDKIDGVTVKSASVENGEARIKLTVNGLEKEVKVQLENNL